MSNFIEFLEDHLGEIQYGWNHDEKGEKIPFQIVKFAGGPFPGTSTYTTLGLSHEPLIYPIEGKEMYQELVFVAPTEFGDQNIPGIMIQVGREMLRKREILLRGEVIGPAGKLFTDTDLEALYVTVPVYFEESFHMYHGDNNMSIIMSWLIPITKKEALFIDDNDWEDFEDLLEAKDPDLTDFERNSMV